MLIVILFFKFMCPRYLYSNNPPSLLHLHISDDVFNGTREGQTTDQTIQSIPDGQNQVASFIFYVFFFIRE